VRVPETARKGEIIEIKTLISHPMETGNRRDQSGALVPRHILKKFICTYRNEVVFSADWYPAIATNPDLAFTTEATESGELVFTWVDDDDQAIVTSAHITRRVGPTPGGGRARACCSAPRGATDLRGDRSTARPAGPQISRWPPPRPW
jgi:sulfur-oxidizing protein SoxZ